MNYADDPGGTLLSGGAGFRTRALAGVLLVVLAGRRGVDDAAPAATAQTAADDSPWSQQMKPVGGRERNSSASRQSPESAMPLAFGG